MDTTIIDKIEVKEEIREVLKWTISPNTKLSILETQNQKKLQESNKIEKEWGNNKVNSIFRKGFKKNISNWTTLLGEGIVKKIFEYNGKKIWKPKKINGYCPDWETEEEIIEVKTRNWTTPGTAGEKVLGVPFKYSDIPRLYNKKLIIVCVAYQEWELTHGKTKIFNEDVSIEKKIMLSMWKSLKIEYVKFSDLIKNLI